MTAPQDARPESPRYFYRDPLAAAWMAKHFGMKLLAESSDEGRLVDAGARFIDCDDTFRELWQHDFSYLGKLYVHPDILHLLEPQVGDVVIAELHGPVRIANFAEFKGRKTIETVSDCYGGGSFYPEGVTSIIQRNGMAFHWPEQEAA